MLDIFIDVFISIYSTISIYNFYMCNIFVFYMLVYLYVYVHTHTTDKTSIQPKAFCK